MTLVFKSSLYREYVSPGTEEDGYVKPEWQVPIRPRFWQGGRGDWIYNGHVGSDANDDPDVVRMVKIGEDTVRMVRERFPLASSPALARLTRLARLLDGPSGRGLVLGDRTLFGGTARTTCC